MTKRNKIVLISSIFLALCVIVTVILNLKYNIRNNTINIESLILIGIIIFLSILSVPVVYFLKVRRNKFEKMLDREYYQKYEVIRDTIAGSQLSNMSKKEVMEDVLDILISAQKSGKSAQDAIDDPQAFSREVLQAYTGPGRLPVLSIIDGILYFIFFILGSNILLWFEQTEANFFDVGIDISMLTFFFIISFILVPFIKRLFATHYYWAIILPIAFGVVFVIFAEIIRRFFYDSEIIRQFLDGTVRMVPGIAILILYIVLIPILIFSRSYIRKKLLKL